MRPRVLSTSHPGGQMEAGPWNAEGLVYREFFIILCCRNSCHMFPNRWGSLDLGQKIRTLFSPKVWKRISKEKAKTGGQKLRRLCSVQQTLHLCQSPGHYYYSKDPVKKHPGSASKVPISLEQFSHLKNRCWLELRNWAFGSQSAAEMKAEEGAGPNQRDWPGSCYRKSWRWNTTNPAGGTLAAKEEHCLREGCRMWGRVKARKSKGNATKAISGK